MNSGLSSAQIMEFKTRFLAWWDFPTTDVCGLNVEGFLVFVLISVGKYSVTLKVFNGPFFFFLDFDICKKPFLLCLCFGYLTLFLLI